MGLGLSIEVANMALLKHSEGGARRPLGFGGKPLRSLPVSKAHYVAYLYIMGC